MSKVTILETVTRLDLPPNRVLDSVPRDMDSVVILGYDADGGEYFASSIADGADVLWLMERLKLRLLQIVEKDADE